MKVLNPFNWLRYIFAVFGIVLIVGLVSGFGRFWANPVRVLFFFGFDVARMFSRWGRPGLGWLIGMIIFVATLAGIFAIFARLVIWFRGRKRDIQGKG